MDFLDPKKETRHHVMLFVGYLLIAIVVVLSAVVLLNNASGYGVDKNGQVYQSGLVFFSSQPSPAKIYIDGQLKKNQTNTRLLLPSNIYNVQIKLLGYRTWQRTIEVDGGKVQHFDYPLLFPTKLTTAKLKNYEHLPGLATQSLDRRWLIVEQPGSFGSFDVYDLNAPTKTANVITLPAGVVTDSTDPAQSLQLVEWADDNVHLVLKHSFGGKSEYVLVNRSDPAQSINLSSTLSGVNGELTLINKKYDQYYFYDAATRVLQSASLKAPAAVTVLTGVITYKPYSDDTLLYVTDDGAPNNEVTAKLLVGKHTYILRSFPIGAKHYLVDYATYNGVPYLVLGDSDEGKVYIYHDPIGQLDFDVSKAISPTQVMHISTPDYVSFSANAQYVMAENGTQFNVYDLENKHGYIYNSAKVIDAPQAHAAWMDGDRLAYVSNGALLVFDYDHQNAQTLMSASPNYLPAYAPDFSFIETLSTGPAGEVSLGETPLVTP